MTDFLHVVTTTATKQGAAEIGRHLLERRFAGCVQVSGPVSSAY